MPTIPSIIVPPTTQLVIPSPSPSTRIPGEPIPKDTILSSASGLWIPGRSGVPSLMPHTIIIPSDTTSLVINGATMSEQAREGYRQIAGVAGRAAADILMAPQMQIIDAIAREERQDAAVSAFLASNPAAVDAATHA